TERPKDGHDEDQWNRLYFTPTLSALRRFNADDSPPPESLDLWLGSVCDQMVDWPISKTDAVRQPITCSQRCMCRPIPFVTERQFDHPLRIGPFCETPKNINSVKLAIDERGIRTFMQKNTESELLRGLMSGSARIHPRRTTAFRGRMRTAISTDPKIAHNRDAQNCLAEKG
ncbi:uncharacterized protein CDAR_102521, partial [Caerostris darwini]